MAHTIQDPRQQTLLLQKKFQHRKPAWIKEAMMVKIRPPEAILLQQPRKLVQLSNLPKSPTSLLIYPRYRFRSAR